MKTQANISNLKRTGLTIFASAILTSGMFAANSGNSASLSNFMIAQEQSIIYKAPAIAEEFEAAVALEDLNDFANQQAASIQYRAPEKAESAEIDESIEALESFAVSEMASVLYVAPPVDPEVEVAVEMESLERLAEKMTATLKYSAPESTEFNAVDEVNENNNNWIAQIK